MYKFPMPNGKDRPVPGAWSIECVELRCPSIGKVGGFVCAAS